MVPHSEQLVKNLPKTAKTGQISAHHDLFKAISVQT